MSGIELQFRRVFERSVRGSVQLLAYMSSMNRAGVPDEYIIINGRSFWLELKAVDVWPKSKDSNILSHKFSGPQVTFMRKVDRAGGRGLGVVGWKDGKTWLCAAIRTQSIDDGTLTGTELDMHEHLVLDDSFPARFIKLLERS